MYLNAEIEIASILSIIRCKAESTPIVISVQQKSLSIDPTIPTMFKNEQSNYKKLDKLEK